MDKITHEIRIANWKSVIEQCQARPKGQSAKQWLADNGIPEKNYYYWQRKIRQETYALIQKNAAPVAASEAVTFTELAFDGSKQGSSSFRPDAIIHGDRVMIELSNTISDRLLDRLMEVMDHA